LLEKVCLQFLQNTMFETFSLSLQVGWKK
jgi:hypothetical protein